MYALHALNVQSDGTFLLPDLEILDINCHGINEDELPETLGIIRERLSGSNVSSIKRLVLRGVVVSPVCQYEMERYVPSLVIIRQVSI